MHFESTEDKSRITKFFLNEKLNKALDVGEINKRNPDPSFYYDVVVDEGEDIGLILSRKINDVLIEIHPMLFPRYWGSIKGKELIKRIKEELKARTKFKSAITYIPELAKEVVLFAYKVNGTLSGSIHNGVQYQGKMCNLLIFNFRF